MSQSHKALIFSILYSVPLTIWLVTQLEFLEWSSTSLRLLFQQTLAVLVLLQAFAAILLFVDYSTQRSALDWLDELTAIAHLLLFPLPFFSLIWLTGSASLSIILNSIIVPASVAAMVFIISRFNGQLFNSQLTNSRASGKYNIIHCGSSLFYVLLAVLVWNYRYEWWHWAGL